MTDQPRAFLPPGALTTDRLRQALSGAIGAWSRAFLPEAGCAEVSGDDHGRRILADDPPDTVGARASLTLTGPGKRRLLELALGESLDGKVLRHPDRGVIDAFAARLSEDLIARLDGLLGSAGGPGMRIDLALGGGHVGSLTVRRDAIVALVRKALPEAAARPALTGRRMDAVSGISVTVEAVLGNSQITAADAHGLAVGDVLVLDRALGEHARLRLEPGGQPVAAGRLHADGEYNAIAVAIQTRG